MGGGLGESGAALLAATAPASQGEGTRPGRTPAKTGDGVPERRPPVGVGPRPVGVRLDLDGVDVLPAVRFLPQLLHGLVWGRGAAGRRG